MAEKTILSVGDTFSYIKDDVLYKIKVTSEDLCDLEVAMNYHYIDDSYDIDDGTYVSILRCTAKNDVEESRLNKAKMLGVSTFSTVVLPKFVALKIYEIDRTYWIKDDVKSEYIKEEIYKELKIKRGDYSWTFRRKKVDKFKTMIMRGVKVIGYGCKVESIVEENVTSRHTYRTEYYEAIPQDGEYVICSNSDNSTMHLEVCMVKDEEIVKYIISTDSRTFSLYGKENRYLLGYVYERTSQGRKIDEQCINDLIELIERLDS